MRFLFVVTEICEAEERMKALVAEKTTNTDDAIALINYLQQQVPSLVVMFPINSG